MIKKIFNIVFFLITILVLIIIFAYPITIQNEIYDIIILWINKILLSLVPMYLISNILINYPYISKILYPILDKILHFESERSCSIFLLSLITGNPTSSLLVISCVKNGEISVEEGNRLLKCTVLSSPLFVISMLGKIGYLVIIISIFVNFILFYKTKVVKSYKLNNSNNNLLDIIDNCPIVMLEILSMMVFVSILKLPLKLIISNTSFSNNIFVNFVLDSFELTTGLNSINNYQVSSILKNFLSCFMLSFGGITIILQIVNNIKKTSLSKTSLITSRIIHGLFTSIILLIIMIFFY